ncbi:MAG TPA: 50S ribosomal protein L37ae [Candidatus Paceibacterota bacterium]|nr:50S ribosomal protein L37ae [Candidatus Paceibacterota bacterium]
MVRTKKVKSAGRFGAGYGTNVRRKFVAVEKKQRVKQTCPFCKKSVAKRKSAGIWYCKFCGKTFADGAYYINQ